MRRCASAQWASGASNNLPAVPDSHSFCEASSYLCDMTPSFAANGMAAGVTRCDGCSALAACDTVLSHATCDMRHAACGMRHATLLRKLSVAFVADVANVVAARLLDPRVDVVGVSQPTLLLVDSLRRRVRPEAHTLLAVTWLSTCMRHAPLYRFERNLARFYLPGATPGGATGRSRKPVDGAERPAFINFGLCLGI